MKSKVTTAPTIEPITLEEVKEHLRLTSTNEDDLILDYIASARQMAEDITGRKFINQTLTGYVDSFGRGNVHGKWWTGTQTGTYFTHLLDGKAFVDFDWTPVSSITQVDTIDDDNVETVYDSSNYYLENYDDDMPARMHLNNNATLPTDFRAQNAVKVQYVAGYGATRSSVPQKLRHAIKMMTAVLYNKRGDCEDGESCACEAGQMNNLLMYKLERA